MGTIFSMTGYAAGIRNIPGGSIALDIRSVNHRHLDLQFRISEELRFLEPTFRKLIISQLTRGKIDCRLTLKSSPSENENLKVNKLILSKIKNLSDQIKTVLRDAQPISVHEALRWPGVLSEDNLSSDELSEAAIELLKSSLGDLLKEKIREGDSLGQILKLRIENINKLVAQLEPLLPNLISKNHKRILTKFEEAKVNPDQDRLQQELIFFAAKTDLDEELQRLKVHLKEVSNIFIKGGVCGKKLDFLAQELNRETNTLSAKSIDVEITKIAIEIKTLIEQLREQFQNIE